MAITIDLDRELHKLRDGKVDWSEFARETAPAWDALAGNLRKRWGRDCAGAVGQEDVVQELLLGAWDSLTQWDPKRGPTLKKYVVWCACNKAKRTLHKARGAILHGSPDRNPSRAAIAENRLRKSNQNSHTADPFESLMGRMAPVAPEQEQVLVVDAIVQSARNSFERSALETLMTTGDADKAAESLGQRQGSRRLRIKNKTAARRVVRDAAERALAALGGA